MTTTVSKPKYVQLADHLRGLIRNGELQVGDRLPSYVEMHRQFGATASTAQRVCDLLEKEQLIERRSGSGVYVAKPQRRLTNSIGIMSKADFRTLPEIFFSHLAHGAQQAAARQEQRLIWLNKGLENENFHEVDGLLLSGHPTKTNQRIASLKPPYMPCVSMFIMAEGMNSVVVDDYGAAKIATRHLLELGHERIACFMLDTAHTPQIPRNRVAGYQDALQEAGIIADPRWTRRAHYPEVALPESVTRHQSFLQWSREQMQLWLDDDWRQLGCTAILAQNDHIAIGMMQILQEANIDVPKQVSVMGFDGTELCDHTTPRLTSIQLPLEQIGAKAVDLLVEQIEKGEPEETIVVLPAKLREGTSTAKRRKTL
jgi:LacI family repressor for deo operon, udp, cdd, tsx, nupC, and nupG